MANILLQTAIALAEVERGHGPVNIVQGGRTVAALVSAEYLESLEETIAVASSDAELVAAIAEEAELKVRVEVVTSSGDLAIDRSS